MSDDDPAPADDDPDDAAPAVQPTVDAGRPQSVRRQRIDALRSFEQSQAFWKHVFETDVGRREMWSILADAHAFEDKFGCGPSGVPDPNATWLAAGEKAVGQRLFFRWLQLDREGVLRMLEEHYAPAQQPDFFGKKRGA